MTAKVLINGKRQQVEIPEPILQFNVFPGTYHFKGKKRGLYFRVYVMDSHQDLMFLAANNGSGRITSDTGAICMGYRTWSPKTKRLSNCLGDLIFHKFQLDGDTISHESAHGGLRWMEETGRMQMFRLDSAKDAKGYVPDSEEHLCYAIGAIAGQIVDGLRKGGLVE